MFRKLIVPALAAALLVPAATLAQSPRADDSASQQVMQKIRDEMTANGLKDVKVVPGSFIVSGTNQEGQAVVMVIGPNATTVLTPMDPDDASQAPQQAQQKDENLKNWE